MRYLHLFLGLGLVCLIAIDLLKSRADSSRFGAAVLWILVLGAVVAAIGATVTSHRAREMETKLDGLG